jgi:hypothetical protein
MKTSLSLSGVMTFAASVVVGCGAAIAIASAAAVSQAAPTLRHSPAAPEVVRLDPVVVTVSKTYYDAVQRETVLVRANDAKKVTRG